MTLTFKQINKLHEMRMDAEFYKEVGETKIAELIQILRIFQEDEYKKKDETFYIALDEKLELQLQAQKDFGYIRDYSWWIQTPGFVEVSIDLYEPEIIIFQQLELAPPWTLSSMSPEEMASSVLKNTTPTVQWVELSRRYASFSGVDIREIVEGEVVRKPKTLSYVTSTPLKDTEISSSYWNSYKNSTPRYVN